MKTVDKPKRKLVFSIFVVHDRTGDTICHQGIFVRYHLQETVGSLNAVPGLMVSDRRTPCLCFSAARQQNARLWRDIHL